MATLHKIDDPQQAFELWQAGLLVYKKAGWVAPWGRYEQWRIRPLTPLDTEFLIWMPDAHVLLED